MAILMSEQIGNKRRRCDARCHHSHGPRCRCICGGNYHGRSVPRESPQPVSDDRLRAAALDPHNIVTESDTEDLP